MQGRVKLYYMQTNEDIIFLLATIRNTLEQCEKSQSYRHHKCIQLFSLFVKYSIQYIPTAMVATLATLYMLIPFVLYWLNGKLELIMPIYIPGVNATDNLYGYAVTTFSQIVLLMLNSIIILPIKMLTVTFLAGPIVFAYLIRLEAKRLNDGLIDGSCTTIEAKAIFRNILLMHHEMTM